MGKKILYVDNNLEIGKSTLEGTDLDFVERRPDELGKDSAVLAALHGIHVVLMDYDLHEEDAASSAPIDGIELLERFRAAIRTLKEAKNVIPLLTIYTGKYDKLVKELNCPSAPYLVARRANVDWVFEKGTTRKGTEITTWRLKSILSGFKFDFSQYGTNDEKTLISFLGLPKDSPWAELAVEQIRDARPPIQTMRSGLDRATLMRWLLQVALPIPGCFVSLEWAAARLHIPPLKLAAAVQERTESNFSKLLDECKYKGELADFHPVRYWKAGIDHLIWKLTQGRSILNTKVSKILAEAIGDEIPRLDEEAPVLLVSPKTFEQTGEITDLKNAVQIQPDLWPAGVDFPWIKISELKNDRELQEIVINVDRNSIPKNAN